MSKLLNICRTPELLQLIHVYYDNEIKDVSLLSLLATEILKKGNELDL